MARNDAIPLLLFIFLLSALTTTLIALSDDIESSCGRLLFFSEVEEEDAPTFNCDSPTVARLKKAIAEEAPLGPNVVLLRWLVLVVFTESDSCMVDPAGMVPMVGIQGDERDPCLAFEEELRGLEDEGRCAMGVDMLLLWS